MFNQLLASGDTIDWDGFQNAITDAIDTFWGPIVAVLGALCVVFGVIIGLKFWNARGDETKMKEAKASLWHFVIGIVVIFAIAMLAPILISILTQWVQNRSDYMT